VTFVECLHVTLPEVAHGARQRFVRARRQQQMNMISHEDIGMDGNAMFGRRITYLKLAGWWRSRGMDGMAVGDG
jgi:hypothetical protein